MKRLIKKSEIFNGMNVGDNYYEIYKNPTSDEFNLLSKEFNILRGMLTLNSELYFWTSEVPHTDAIKIANVPDGIHLEYNPGSNRMHIFLTPECNPQNLKQAFLGAKSLLNTVGISENTLIGEFNTSYYGAKYYKDYDNIMRVKNIFELNDSEEKIASRLKKVAEIFNGMNIGEDYYEVFKNPTPDEVATTNKEAKNVGIRGIMCSNGDVYIWPYNILHDRALGMAGIPNEIHFAFEYGTMTVFLKQGEDVQKLIDTMKNCKPYLDKIGVKSSNRLQIDSSYYGAKKYQFYDFVETVDDIYSVSEGQMKMISGG